MPRFLELERSHRSVILGLRATTRMPRGGAGARYGMFVAPAEGMGALVDAVAMRLPEGVVRLGRTVESIGRDGERWRLRTATETLDADALVLATPAFAAAPLLAPLDASLARALDGIEYASSATVTLGFRAADVAGRLTGFGFVGPFVERRALLACPLPTRKYPRPGPGGPRVAPRLRGRRAPAGARRAGRRRAGDDSPRRAALAARHRRRSGAAPRGALPARDAAVCRWTPRPRGGDRAACRGAARPRAGR